MAGIWETVKTLPAVHGGLEELDTTEWLHFHFSLPCIGERNGNPLQCSCLENPSDGRAWWAVVYGVAQSWTRLSNFTFTFHFHALEKEMATHSSVLAWRIPGMGETGVLPSMGLHRVRHDWSDLAATAVCLKMGKSMETGSLGIHIQRLTFLYPTWTSSRSQFTYCWSLAWRILSIPLLKCEMSAIVQ